MEILEKPFIDVDNQLEKLVDRGLIIKDPLTARIKLLRTSYYDLINGYKDMFLEEKKTKSEEDCFIEGTTFEDILELHTLDRKIRHLVLEVLLDVECIFYSSMAYSISSTYGEKHTEYLQKEKYKMGRKQRYNNRFERDNLLFKINKKITNPDVQPLIYYKEKYGNIPPWILVKDLSFGELVMLYKLSKDNVKNEVIKNIIGKTPTDKDKEFFLKCVELFNKYRNWAAHGGRMYNHRTNIQMPYIEELHSILQISKAEHNKGNGRSDFAAVILGVIYFFKKEPTGLFEFFINLNYHMDEYQKKRPLKYERVIKELGLPGNYYKVSLENLVKQNNETG